MSKGEKAQKKVDDLSGNRKVLLDKAVKTAEFAVKYGTEIANSYQLVERQVLELHFQNFLQVNVQGLLELLSLQ